MSITPLEAMRRLGINPEPATHAEYVESWNALRFVAKGLTAMEMTMRKALFASTFPNPKEGANNFLLQDGRRLAASRKINRTIDETQISLARAEYQLLNDRPVEFDELLKVKHELVVSAYRKVEVKPGDPITPAFSTISRMVISKPSAPDMEIK